MNTAAPSVTLPNQYYGSTTDRDHCEVLAIQYIDHKLLTAEARLYNLKWFDYRAMHPVLATYLFVHHYNSAYGTFMGQAYNMEKRFMNAFKGKDFMSAREKKSFWKLRQTVDELGIRYEFFMRAAMNWYHARGWTQAPRPQHVNSNAEMIVDVTNLWVEECRAKIQFATSPRYTAAAFVGGADQLAYEAFIVDQIGHRAHPKYALNAALYVFDALRIETAVRHFPTHVVADAGLYCLADDQ